MQQTVDALVDVYILPGTARERLCQVYHKYSA